METSIEGLSSNPSYLKFLSYLWGMETSKEFRFNTFGFFSSYPTYEEWKLFSITKTPAIAYCSYPTYEEWKPNSNWDNIELTSLSFLSYLWGMETNKLNSLRKSFFRSYPTYEEWKPIYLYYCFHHLAFPFLSYLWGMETLLSYPLH